jgi:1-acyl-sn-glycerol-3-phosphate acyltransferase
LSFFLRLYRVVKVAFVFAYATVEVLILRPKSRADRAAWLSQIGKRLLRAVDVTYTILGPVPTTGAVITNHLTYVDILLHGAMRPCVFVSKIELRKTPVLGWISMMAGTVYVARGAGGSAAKAAQGMAQGFEDGLPVVFFPEGTTGVGDQPVMPFRSGLLSQTIASGVPVWIGFIRYTLSPRDLAAGKTLREDVHWGRQGLWEHIWNFAGLHGLRATVVFSPTPVVFSPAALTHRKLAAVEARAALLALSERPLPPA